MLHVLVICLIGVYTVAGAYTIRVLEAKRVVTSIGEEIMDENGTLTTILLESTEYNEYWTWTDAILFCFTIITTIGYGNVAPATTHGQLFVILYGIFGVPLTMIVMANIGKFLSETFTKLANLMSSIMSDYSKEISLMLAFVTYIYVGSLIIATYEPEMDVFKAIYFNFVTLTTIGLGDVVPQSQDYLFLTIIYIIIGLALTTIAIEIASDYLRKLHYFGRKIENVSSVNIWFGGKKLTMRQLIKNLGDQLNLDMDVLNQLDLDTFVDNAIKVEEGLLASLRSKNVDPIKPIIATDFQEIQEKGEDDILFADEDEQILVLDYSDDGRIVTKMIEKSTFYNFV